MARPHSFRDVDSHDLQVIIWCMQPPYPFLDHLQCLLGKMTVHVTIMM